MEKIGPGAKQPFGCFSLPNDPRVHVKKRCERLSRLQKVQSPLPLLFLFFSLPRAATQRTRAHIVYHSLHSNVR
eukprot:scaffold1079_cov35-Tisochrysis_lutea.AAC.2